MTERVVKIFRNPKTNSADCFIITYKNGFATLSKESLKKALIDGTEIEGVKLTSNGRLLIDKKFEQEEVLDSEINRLRQENKALKEKINLLENELMTCKNTYSIKLKAMKTLLKQVLHTAIEMVDPNIKYKDTDNEECGYLKIKFAEDKEVLSLLVEVRASVKVNITYNGLTKEIKIVKESIEDRKVLSLEAVVNITDKEVVELVLPEIINVMTN